MRWSELKREPCSVARTVSVIGDRWTLLILRDCFLRVRRFEEFQARLGITRHVLADRLRKLVRAGVLRKEMYQTASAQVRIPPHGQGPRPASAAAGRRALGRRAYGRQGAAGRCCMSI